MSLYYEVNFRYFIPIVLEKLNNDQGCVIIKCYVINIYKNIKSNFILHGINCGIYGVIKNLQRFTITTCVYYVDLVNVLYIYIYILQNKCFT